MSTFITYLILGLSYGMILFLLATGMTLTMGLMRVVNMSHGAIYLISGYTGMAVYEASGSWLLALLCATVTGAALGAFIEIGFLRRLYDKPTNQVLLTIGFINIINNVTQWIWGGFPKSPPNPPIFDFYVRIGGVGIPVFRLFIIVFGLVMAFLLWYLQDRTRVGAMVRAGMDNKEVASTLGLNNKLIFTCIFVLGSLVAGMTSFLGGGQMTGLNMSTSWSILLNSIIVVVIGGTGSIQGALIGGLIIGLVDSFGKAYFSDFAAFLIYLVLVVVLLVKPTGLMGRKMDVDKASDDSVSKVGSAKRRRGVWKAEELGLKTPGELLKLKCYRGTPYALALVLIFIVPIFISQYTQSIMTKVLVYALFAMSLDIIMGYTGMRSFGHAAYFGLGGYIVGLFAVHLGITNFWIILPCVIVISALASAIISYFTLRTSGTYFLMVTMAFGQMLSVIAEKWYKVTGGSDGLLGFSRPNLGFIDINWDSTKLYYFTAIIFLVCYIILHCIMRSSYGRSLVGVRENEGRMRALGFNTWRLKYSSMIIAGTFAGIAGLLFAYQYMIMTPKEFTLETSAMPMLMVIMGGGATLWGPAIGAAVIILVQSYAGIWFPDRWPLILGIMYVVCVMFLRGGFSHYLRNVWDKVGEKLFLKSKAADVAAKED